MSLSVKDKIQAHFNKASSSYDQHCTLQNTICQQSIALLLKYKNSFPCMADLACGTGQSTWHLIQHLSYDVCYALDLAGNLLQRAQQKLGTNQKVAFIQGDLETSIFKHSCLDLIFCNMGLQWATDLSQSFKEFYTALRPLGMILFSMPIEGNFPEMKQPFKLSLPTHETILNLLKERNFDLLETDIQFFPLSFSNHFHLLQSLKNVGANYNKFSRPKPAGLSKLQASKLFHLQDTAQLTYKIGFYLARKN